jgi:RNA polymerase sigma-70 factor, ECF subfamily
MTVDDAALVAEVLNGGKTAWTELMHRHFHAAFAAARALTATEEDAEDACQDAMARAYFRLGDCHSPAQFRGWLLQIVRRRSHNLRAYQLLRAATALDDVAEPIARDSPSRDFDRHELGNRLRDALAELLPVRRQVVIHHDVDGWTHPQIAVALGISALMSRRHLSDARRHLRTLLADYDPEVFDD